MKDIDIEKISQNYFARIKEQLNRMNLETIRKIAQVLFEAYQNQKQVFIFGNGGSAATASHFACDLGKGILIDARDEEEKRFKVISLTDNVAFLTALGNDLAYEDIFWGQLNHLLNQGDVVIGISASGNSPNVIRAIEFAKKKGAVTVGLCGFTGGKLSQLADYEITVKENHYGVSEDVHLIITHLIKDFFIELKNKTEVS